MKKARIKGTVGAKMIQGLEEFADALKKKETIPERFTCRIVLRFKGEFRGKPSYWIKRLRKSKKS